MRHKPLDPVNNWLGWQIVLVLLAGSVLNYLNRAALGILMPQIRNDLSLSNTGYGVVVNIFLVTYTIFYIMGGHISDRLGVRRSFYFMVLFWSAASMLHSLVQSFVSLGVVRALLGIGQGGYYPAAYKGLSEWFTREKRAKASGILTSGASIGALISAPVISWLTIKSAWQTAFLIVGASNLLLIPVWFFLQKKARRTYGEPDPAPAFTVAGAASEGSTGVSLRDSIRNKNFLCLLAARAITDAVWYFHLFWMSGYFQTARGYSLATVGRFLWIPYFAATLGAWAAGWINGFLIGRGLSISNSRKVSLFISGLFCAAGALTDYAPGSRAALLIVSLALFGHMAWITSLLTAITEVSPQQHVAVLFGITGAAGTIAGALSQPLVGYVVDKSGYGLAYVSCGAIFITALILILLTGQIGLNRPAAGD